MREKSGRSREARHSDAVAAVTPVSTEATGHMSARAHSRDFPARVHKHRWTEEPLTQRFCMKQQFISVTWWFRVGTASGEKKVGVEGEGAKEGALLLAKRNQGQQSRAFFLAIA